ncbi:MAG: LacI family DNA-binding transcriptional regulator [Opitutales bacterium]|jgi:LacI family transcriptional regulator
MGKINQQELASLLNLSQTTVSRSLANHPAINAETKALVLETAAKMGYNQRIKRPSAGNGEHRPGVLGILISMPKKFSGQSETFQEVLRGIADKSSFHDSILDVVYHDPGENDSAQLIRRIRSAKWKGVILIYPIERSLALDIAHQSACVSIVENYRHDLIDSVDVDQTDAIITMVRTLHERGHRKIGFLTWMYTVPTPWVLHRFGSYVEGLYACDLDFDPSLAINVRNGENLQPDECARRAAELIRSGVTAIICPADHQAYHLMQSLNKMGIRVPEDVSLTGFDGIPPPLQVKQLATVKVPYQELGRSAVHQLLRRMEQPTAPRRHILVDGDILEGSTIRNLTS